MNIIFFGSAQFAVSALEVLIKSAHDVVCVVTQPDKKKGRHLHLAVTDVKSTALVAELNVFQPLDIKSKDSVMHLKSFKPDLFVIVAYGQILSQEVLDIPKIMPINIHASFLPAYRGAAPINWALINGESSTGVTIMKVTRKMDSGPIINQEKIRIEQGDTAITLEKKLHSLGAKLLLETLKAIEGGVFKLLPQDEKKRVLHLSLKKRTVLFNGIRRL